MNKDNLNEKEQDGILRAWSKLLSMGSVPNIVEDRTERAKTLAPYNFNKVRMRRKMAKRSRRINRHQKGKRKRK